MICHVDGSFRSRRLAAALAAAFLLAMPIATAASGDKPGTADHPLAGRYEDSTIKNQIVKGFEEITLPTAPFPATGTIDMAKVTKSFAGKLTSTLYEGPGDRSALEVVRNYETALQARGFTKVFACRQKECGAPAKFWTAARGPMNLASKWDTTVYTLLSLDRPEGRVWVGVMAIELAPTTSKPLMASFIVNVVEEKPLDTDRMVVLDSATLSQSIESTGKVAIYGIHFDTGSEKLKAESAPQIAEIAKLLKSAPKLSVLVVGHTDTQGTLDINRSLSERRAATVVAALTGEHGIDKARLYAVGVGPAAPVASNRTEEGRARNRRVEVVELKAE